MLTESFVFLPGIGELTEQKLWLRGVHDWSTFLSAVKIKGLSRARKETYDKLLHEAHQKLYQENAGYFYQLLPFTHQWRLYENFKSDAVFLDIETSGYYGNVIMVGLFDGVEVKTFVRGINLDRRLLENELRKYKLLVTFNGASFDLPVIKRYFGLDVPLPHVDLRFVCQRLNLGGGLKAVERRLGIKRRPEVEGLLGCDAPNLWRLWRYTGNKEYLERLALYNEEDIVNLYPIAEKLIPRLWKQIRPQI